MQPQAYVTSDAWDNPSTTVISLKNGSSNKHQNSGSNSCNDSLDYSACSSAQSAESSNDSLFSKIMDNVIDREGEGANYGACGGGEREGNDNAAVQEYYRRAQQQAQVKQMQLAQQKKKKQPQYNIAKQPVPLNKYVNDVFGEGFDETIAGLDDDIARPNSQSQASPYHTNNQKDSFFQSTSSSNKSAPSASRFRPSNGHITPTSNSGQNHTSTPSGNAITPILRTNSRHSKSSSDGSCGTPVPSSPPHTNSGMMSHGNSSSMRPPHVRSTPASEKGRVSDDNAELSYAEPWMCGFADAFNFDEFGKFGE